MVASTKQIKLLILATHACVPKHIVHLLLLLTVQSKKQHPFSLIIVNLIVYVMIAVMIFDIWKINGMFLVLTFE